MGTYKIAGIYRGMRYVYCRVWLLIEIHSEEGPGGGKTIFMSKNKLPPTRKNLYIHA